MTQEETLNLINLAQNGDKSAAQTLIQENDRLVWSVCKRYYGSGVEADDLYQLGCLGFLKAVQGFDTSFGTRFSTYAVPKIAGEIRRYIRDDGAVKVSRTVKERAQMLKLEQSRLEQRLGREPTVEELAEVSGVSPEDIAFTFTATVSPESLQQENGEEGFKLEDVLGDYNAEEHMLTRFAIEEAMAKLPDREKMIISLRYFHGLTQMKTASVLGVSQVQISRLEKKAVERMREAMA